MLILPAPGGLSASGWHAAAVTVLMAVWWITEALPISATSLLPIVLFPLLGVTGISEATSPYANPLIFLFMGGFMIAMAMQRWDLHRRIALNIVHAIGIEPRSIIIGFILASAFLSMWVSNTATAMMMLPIAVSVLKLIEEQRPAEKRESRTHFEIVLVLSIAYACNIGGMATLIGTPPNALFAGFMSENYGVEIGFAQWMLVGVPLVLIGLPLMYLVLTRWIYPVRLEKLPGGRDVIREELRKLGPMSKAEWMVAAVFAGAALLWITRPLLDNLIPGLSDANIAMGAALLLFAMPVSLHDRLFVLDWEHARDLPWGVLLLFGGGLSLAAAINGSGLAGWIGQSVHALSTWPLPVIILFVITLIVFLTEITSNTATTAAFLPILASAAIGIGHNPMLLAIPAALSASCAFMLPVATPPNAIVYGSGKVSIPQMTRAGIWLNMLFILLLTAATYTLILYVFGIGLNILPAWAG